MIDRPSVDLSRRLNAERLVVLGWPRAILLQLAHPLIAAGVADYSSFREGRLAAAARLHQTVRAMLSLTFGGKTECEGAVARIRSIHRSVKGTLREGVGVFPAGTPYSAEDPELLVWVHATLLDSIPRVYERVVAPLSESELDCYCQQAEWVVRTLGARNAEVPCSWRSLQAYMSGMYASGRIEVSPLARELSTAVLTPPFAHVLAPATYVTRLITSGLLPPALRAQYGLRWSATEEKALERWTRVMRAVRRRAPDLVTLWRDARLARRSGPGTAVATTEDRS